MYSDNRRPKFNVPFLILSIVLLALVSIGFGAIISSANAGSDGQTSKDFSFGAAPDGFLPSRILSFLEGHGGERGGINSEPIQPEKIADSPIFAEFDAWVEFYAQSNNTVSDEQIEIGGNLATQRRQELEKLMRSNPRAALEKTVSAATLNRLPASIADRCEKRISADGDFEVYAIETAHRSTGESNGSRIDRQVVIGGARYEALVYGRRETMTTKLNVPLHGVIVGETMIVDESPLRKIDSAEYASRAIDSAQLGTNGVAAEVGGKVLFFSDQSEMRKFAREQIEWEAKIGPIRSGEPLAPQEQASAWTEGMKKVLVIRVDFSDKPGEPLDHYNQPLTLSRAQNLINNEVSSFYANNSYNKTSMQATVTSVVRLPQTQAYYSQGGNFNVMLADARIAARAAGFETDNFDLDLVTFSYTPNIGFVGIAAIGSKSAMLNGAFYLPETAHELGHNYGLLHANLWRTTDGTVIGAGSNVEYGDCYDNMGACVNGNASRHFNVRYKRILDWLTDANVRTVTASGVYRIFAQDSSSAGNIRSLKISKDATKNYWVEFRQLIAGNAQNGALIRWDYSSRSFQETQVLDMNPATNGVRDEPLLIGQSFYDSASNIRITVVGKGGTTPESLDVNVELNSAGGTPTPTPSCTYAISATSQSFGVTGGTGTIAVTTSGGCSWTASSNQSFVTISSGSSGTGSGTVNYSVAANTGTARTGTLTIAGQTFTVQQTGTGVSSYTLVASPTTVAPGGQITVNFTAPAGSAVLDWIGLFRVGTPNTQYLDGGYTNGLTAGTLNGIAPAQAGQYEFRYLLNDGYTSVATSNAFTVQSGATPTPTPTCTYSITPTNQNFAAAGGSGVINVTTQSGCAWTASSNQSFVSIASGSSGAGNGTISFSVAANTSSSARTAIISIADKIFTVSQPTNIISDNFGAAFDFDGDLKSDISVFRPSTGIWYLQQSSAGFTGLQFGAVNDKLVPADYDGDGRADIAVFRDGSWFIQRSSNGFANIQFGAAEDIPVPADFDGDGKSDVAVFRPSNGTWFIQRSSAGSTAVQFGSSGDKPVAADFDGDGKSDLAVFRPSTGIWYLQQSAAGLAGIQFGSATDKLVAADYDGDGRTDVAVYRPAGGFWYINRSTAGFTGIQFGASTDAPVPADYDGDGKTDVAVFRNGTWYLQNSASGFSGVQFGSGGDKPAPNAFVP